MNECILFILIDKTTSIHILKKYVNIVFIISIVATSCKGEKSIKNKNKTINVFWDIFVHNIRLYKVFCRNIKQENDKTIFPVSSKSFLT